MVKVDKHADGKIYVITLNRPHRMNSIGDGLGEALYDAYAEFRDDPNARVSARGPANASPSVMVRFDLSVPSRGTSHDTGDRHVHARSARESGRTQGPRIDRITLRGSVSTLGRSRRCAGVLLAALTCAVLAGSGFDSTVSAQSVIDYDSDDDGLIEVANLDRPNAIRWDLNGDGNPENSTGDYMAAFPNAMQSPRMGCPSGYSGYELIDNLDFAGVALNVGGLVRWNNGPIRDSYVGGAIRGTSQMGGLIGSLTIAADDESPGLKLSSLAVTATGRAMYPSFEPDIRHYAVGCGEDDRVTITAAAPASLRLSIGGVQRASGVSHAVTVAGRSDDSVFLIELGDVNGALDTYAVHCLRADFPFLTAESNERSWDGLTAFSVTVAGAGPDALSGTSYLIVVDQNGVPRFRGRSTGW